MTEKSASVLTQLKSMKRSFWVSNAIEAFERLAFFGVRAVLPLYMISSVGGGLGMTYTEKGIIYSVWALLQCLVPMVSGGFSENFGYKKSLIVAFIINTLGYLVMAYAYQFPSTFWGMMLAGILVGTGTAIFKPPVQGMVAKSLDESNSSLGFGIFYWVVNIGGFLAPMASAWLRGDESNPTWHYVFLGAAIVTVLNILVCLVLFQDPPKTENVEKKKPTEVFIETLKVLWNDKSMLGFLLIVSGFWFMFMQLWDLLPNFLDEWVDRSDIGNFLLKLGLHTWVDSAGQAKPEILINIDSFTIILLVLPLSWLFGKFKMINALVIGMIISLIGFIGAGMTPIGWVAAFMIFVFAIGEIICSPKFSEYIGMTAPADKKALYMGYSNIPFAIGWAAGNAISGPLYDLFSSKTNFATKYLLNNGHTPDSLKDLTLPQLMEKVVSTMGPNATLQDANIMLWNANNPWVIWIILGSIGALSLVGMIIFYKKSMKK